MTSQRAVPDGPGGNRKEVGRGTQASSERTFPDGGPGPASRPAPALDDDDDMMLILAVTVGATAAAFVLGGVGYVLWLLAQQPAVALERLAAVVTLAVGFGAMVGGLAGSARGRR